MSPDPTTLAYDVDRLRAHFPQLAGGTAFFDGPGGTQTPDVVADAVRDTLLAPLSNRGRVTASEQRAEAIVVAARTAMGDLLGVPAEGVAFGRSMTDLTYDVARALAKDWRAGDEVVVTRLDHDANVRPWVQAAAAVGATARFADFDAETGELPVAAVAAVLGERTRLVAVTGASNLLGTRPDLPAIAAAVHDAGALLFVDGVHLTPHAPVDLATLGADLYACSPYKFLGPHCGVLAGDPARLATLRPDKLLPSSDAVPERFELGTLPYELLAGTTAAVDLLADLVPGEGDRRTRLQRSLAVLEAHEDALRADLEARLVALGVHLYGRAARRTPTVLLDVPGVEPVEVYRSLATDGVNAPAGTFYAHEAAQRLGIVERGAVRAGLAPYTNASDVDRLVEGIERLAG